MRKMLHFVYSLCCDHKLQMCTYYVLLPIFGEIKLHYSCQATNHRYSLLYATAGNTYYKMSIDVLMCGRADVSGSSFSDKQPYCLASPTSRQQLRRLTKDISETDQLHTVCMACCSAPIADRCLWRHTLFPLSQFIKMSTLGSTR